MEKSSQSCWRNTWEVFQQGSSSEHIYIMLKEEVQWTGGGFSDVFVVRYY